jgi:RNA polymerase sigma-70 factor (ECF subfamily)
MSGNMKALKEEFLEILANYQGILHKVSLVYFKNKIDREDNIQEIIYQLWKSYPTLKNRNSIGSWIYAVSINTSLSRIKKELRVEYREAIPELSDKSDFIENLSMNESLNLLLNAIYHLDELDKSIMLLYLEEKSYDEIAGIIGISKSNVGVRINRAKETLKHTFKVQSHGK